MRGGVLQEGARHFPRWNQTLPLLWFEDDRVPSSASDYVEDDDDEEPALRPLDGVLPWPTRVAVGAELRPSAAFGR